MQVEELRVVRRQAPDFIVRIRLRGNPRQRLFHTFGCIAKRFGRRLILHVPVGWWHILGEDELSQGVNPALLGVRI